MKRCITLTIDCLKSIKRSSAYRLGNLLGRSARNPLWAVTGLPKGLVEIVRSRESAASQAALARDALSAADGAVSAGNFSVGLHSGVADALRSRIRLSNGSSATVPRPLVAHISHPAFGGLRRSAWEIDLSPNECLETVERDLPAAIVIDSSAFLAGSPWAGAGTGEDPKKATSLVELLLAAGRYGIPCVFRWHVAPGALPGVMRLSNSCDQTVTASRAVSHDRFPVLTRGIAIENWTPVAGGGRHPTVAGFETSDLLLSLHGNTQAPLASLRDGTSGPGMSPIPYTLMRQPEAMRKLLAGATIASFPSFPDRPIPPLEVAALGLPVVGGYDSDLHFIDPGKFGWSEDDCNLASEEARRDLTSTRWSIWKNASTIAEARALGTLLGDSDLASIGGVTIVVVSDGDVTEEVAMRVRAFGEDADQVVLLQAPGSQPAPGPPGVASVASWSDAAALASKTNHGQVLLVDSAAAATSSTRLVREHLTGTNTDQGVLVETSDLAGLTNDAAGRILESQFSSARANGQGRMS